MNILVPDISIAEPTLHSAVMDTFPARIVLPAHPSATPGPSATPFWRRTAA